MILKKRSSILIMIIITAFLPFLLASCTPLLPMPDSAKKDRHQYQIVKPNDKQQFEQSSYAAIEKKGDEQIKAGNYRGALNTYNNLLSKYSGTDKKRLLDKTEALLSIMKTSDLEIVLQSNKNLIPESMLLYRIGMNYVKQKNNKKAKEFLSLFLSKYPDDTRAVDAKKVLNKIETKFFVKNAIGCMLPLSGKYQVFGKQALRGVKLALKDAQELYSGKDIIFDIKDTESNDNRAVERVQELANSEIAAIAGPMVTSEEAAKEAQKYQVPMICMTQKGEVTSAGEYIFSNFITPEMQVKGLVSYAKEQLQIDRFAIIAPNDKYGQTFMSLFKQIAAQSGGEIIFSEIYRENQSNFSDIIKRFASIQSESLFKTALFIPDSPSRAVKILPQLTYKNVKDIYLLGTNIWNNKALLKISSEHLNNIVITDSFFAQSSKPETARFAQAFKQLYGEDPGFIEAVAYDTASMLIKTAMDPSINSRDALRNALSGNLIYNGVTGETMFEPNGNARKELFFLTIENKEFTEIRN